MPGRDKQYVLVQQLFETAAELVQGPNRANQALYTLHRTRPSPPPQRRRPSEASLRLRGMRPLPSGSLQKFLS